MDDEFPNKLSSKLGFWDPMVSDFNFANAIARIDVAMRQSPNKAQYVLEKSDG